MGEVGTVNGDGEVQGEPGAGGGYAEHRPLLFSIAYRMTGSVGDAEDVAQEAFARMAEALRGGTAVSEPQTYLATAAVKRVRSRCPCTAGTKLGASSPGSSAGSGTWRPASG